MGVVQQTQFLMMKFQAARLKAPSGQALFQAVHRVAEAYADAKERRGRHALEKVEQFRESKCTNSKQQAMLESSDRHVQEMQAANMKTQRAELHAVRDEIISAVRDSHSEVDAQ